jgi:DNA polymerase elongation subunit (family B)
MKLIESLNPEDILFLDIETVSQFKNLEELDEAGQQFWEKKSKSLTDKSGLSPEETWPSAAIYAEFGKIICVSVGQFRRQNGARKLVLKSYFGDDEKQVLQSFAGMLSKHFSESRHLLCAHNGKEFDFPYLARRMMILGIKIPAILDTSGKKPWEVAHLDTMELWKFGDRKSYTSLALLAHVFNIPTPKDDIDGSQVGHVYYEEKNLHRIETYCKKDVLTIAQVFLRFRGEDLLREEEIEIV